jgi:hypothetical protein
MIIYLGTNTQVYTPIFLSSRLIGFIKIQSLPVVFYFSYVSLLSLQPFSNIHWGLPCRRLLMETAALSWVSPVCLCGCLGNCLYVSRCRGALLGNINGINISSVTWVFSFARSRFGGLNSIPGAILGGLQSVFYKIYLAPI